MTEQLIFESKKSKVFFVKNDTQGIDTALKLLNSEFPSSAEVNQFYNESLVTEGINIDGVRKVISTAKTKNRHALILEWFEGKTLLEAFKNKERDIVDFLYIAIAITKSLSELHGLGIIHKDINPSNILVNLQERKIKIIDFEIASKIQTKTINLGHPRNLQGTLEYCSPEQTGRMNRSIDFRSDLYSLGITFYTILAGHPPFRSEDAMELVHSHIALRPTALHDINPAIPMMLSEIVSALMEKNAEDRYQSAHGLNHDLEFCLNQVLSNNGSNRYKIREHDHSSAFHIGQKLYGRENEIQKILTAFNECADGKSQLLLIAGYSGTGKTSLVHEAHKPITLKNGYYAEWKFDQFNKSTPYSAFLQIFSNLIDILLSEKEEELDKISNLIKNAVGAEGKVLTDLLPNLEMLIGTQPAIPSLGGEESSRRLTYLIQKFFAVLCTKEHPIVFFIDDLQWADAASIQLLKNLLTLPGGSHFLCIGAYRDNEVKVGHPLLTALTSIENDGVQIETITVSNLTLDDVHLLLCDSLNKDQNDTDTIQLSKLVLKKTLGNAFFTVQFLKSLAELELLQFNYPLKKWSWDIEKIHAQNITDNVVELMADKVQKLPPPAQRLLMLMACMGNAADLEMLCVVSETPMSDNQSNIYPALKEGLVFYINDKKLKFSHDRIQQAVYSLLDENKRTETHYSIGKLLQQNTSTTNGEELLFDIVNHYNSAVDIFLKGTPHQRLELATLNYKAALKAKLNSAFEVALDYLLRAERLFNNAPWKHHYEFTFSVYQELIEVSYLCARYDLTDQYFKEINLNAATAIDRVKAYHIKINTFKAKNDLPAAIEAGLEALEILGNKLPRHPGKADVLLAIVMTEFRLRNVTLKAIEALPEMSDPVKIEAMRVMTNISPSAYWAEPNLIPLIANRMIRMTLHSGSNILSAWCFAGYGIILCGALGAMRKGQKYGEMGLKIHERYNTKEWKTQVEDPVYALILHWNKHVELSLLPLRNSFYTGLEAGENEFACVNANIYCIHSFLCGKPLLNLDKETHAFSLTFQSLKQETQFNYNEVYRQAMLCLMGEASDPCALMGTAYNSDHMLEVHQDRKDKTGIFFIYFLKGMLHYFFGRYEKAFEFIQKAHSIKEAVLAKFEIPNLYFYQSLSALALLQNSDQSRKRELLGIAKSGLRKLNYYAKYAPENFMHKCLLIQSQMAVAKGDFNDARLLFDRTLSEANKQRFIHEEALAYELAGKSYHEKGFLDLASFYLNNALKLYLEWGAQAKVDHLLMSFPKYFTLVSSSTTREDKVTHVTSVNSLATNSLDVNTLLKASTSISSEVELPQLLTKLMKIVIESAGAQKGILALQENNELWLEAVYDIHKDQPELLQHNKLHEHADVPVSIIQYIHRTRKIVESHSFETLHEFTRDPYLTKHQPESILGIPIVNQGKLVGVIYLENQLTKNVFTKERVTLLSMLSSQIAVSIDNALLYKNLEEKVAERTLELASEKQKSDTLLFNILPKAVAEELKDTGKTQPKYYEAVTILFTDFVGFSNIAKNMSAHELVTTVDDYFREFDSIINANHLEKIKTIGDSYMCAGGLPVPNSTHAFDAIRAARSMIEVTEKINKKNQGSGRPALEIRIGIHTGPVVAGVVGTDKFAYDIWGNAVNKASRLESNGLSGKINISEETFKIVNQTYPCSFRGKIDARNIGEINMYFVEAGE